MFASATKLWMFLRALQVIKKIFLEETELFGKFVQPAVGTANLTLFFRLGWILTGERRRPDVRWISIGRFRGRTLPARAPFKFRVRPFLVRKPSARCRSPSARPQIAPQSVASTPRPRRACCMPSAPHGPRRTTGPRPPRLAPLRPNNIES